MNGTDINTGQLSLMSLYIYILTADLLQQAATWDVCVQVCGSSLGIPRRSPIGVLTGPDPAQLVRRVQGGMAVGIDGQCMKDGT